MEDYIVTDTDDLEAGERIVIELAGRQIGVFNIDGEYYAYANWCAHQGGPVCEGGLTGDRSASFDRSELETTVEWEREGEIVVCPWHGWQYDLTTGECSSRPGLELPSYPVRVEDGKVVVTV